MYARHQDVVLRREHFGGIAFHKRTGTLIELDRQACILLENADGKTSFRLLAEKIEKNSGTKVNVQDVYDTVEELRGHEFLVKNGRSFAIEATKWPKESDYLSAPETVHLAVTHRCNFTCESCYVKPVSQEMTTAEIKSLIDEMAEMKVFQVAIGGGEPFLRDDLIDIVRYAAQKGIVPNITTNGSFITPETASRLSGFVGQIQISVNHLDDNSRDEKSHELALRAIGILIRHDINYGINTLITKNNCREINNIVKFAVDHAAGTINFIRPKPSKDINWYEDARLAKEEFVIIGEALQKAQYEYPIKITVDCAFSFLMKNETPEELTKHGVYGCTSAKRFLSVHPDGSAYPCSFISGYSAGNVKDCLKKVWQSFNDFREVLNQVSCPSCNNHCFGCRTITLHEAGNILAKEP